MLVKFLNAIKEWFNRWFGDFEQPANVVSDGVMSFPEPRVEKWVLCWGAANDTLFNMEVCKICTELGWTNQEANWLMGCMAFETGGTFKPDIKNLAGSGATGLIQFMPNTALSLGTTVKALRKMSKIKQLDFVYLYFKPYRKKIKSFDDMYMAILMPKYIGKPASTFLMEKPSIAYRQNLGLDKNLDGVITKAEASGKAKEWFMEGMKSENTSAVEITTY